MRNLLALALALSAACATSETPSAKPASGGAKHGEVTISIDTTDKPKCHASFRHPSGRVTPLIVAPSCRGGAAGVSMLAVSDPLTTPGGDEYRLFHIASARGDNPALGNDYWAVAIRGDDTWITSLAFTSRELKVASVTDTNLVIEEPSTTTEVGHRYVVTFGSFTKSTLPLLVASTTKTTVVLEGELKPGARPDDRPSLDGSVIGADGECSIDALLKQGGRLRMTAELTKWSDGRSLLKCVSVER